MPAEYTGIFKVRISEVDPSGYARASAHVDYLQNTLAEAIDSSSHPLDWYWSNNVHWIIRRLQVQFSGAAAYGDDVEVRTWVSKLHRVRATREYEMRRAADSAPILRARGEWIFIDVGTSKPVPVPDDIIADISPGGPAPDLTGPSGELTIIEDAHQFSLERRVQHNELDVVHHVNHIYYLNWVEDAYFEARRAVGFGDQETRKREGWRVLPDTHDFEFFSPVGDGDKVEIVSWISEVVEGREVWTHEVYNPQTETLLARNRATRRCVSLDMQPATLPQAALDALVQGKR